MKTRRLLALAAFGLGGLWARSAPAEVALIPASDGHLGALLAAGPFAKDPGGDPGQAKPDQGGSFAGTSFRLLSVADGAFDLDRAFGTGKRAGSTALVGGVLDLGEDLDGWLLVSADGPISAWADGKRVWKRDTARLRGSAWDAAPLSLGKGRHTLVLALRHPGQWWALELRVLDARDLTAPRGMRWRLPGTNDDDAKKLGRDLLSASLRAELEADGYHPSLELDYRRGVPDGVLGPIRVRAHAGKASFDRAVGPLSAGARGVAPMHVALPLLLPEDLSGRTDLGVDVKLGALDLKLKSGLDAALPPLVARAEAAAKHAESGSPKLLDGNTVATTLRHLARSLGDKPSARSLLEHDLAELDQGHDPMRGPGILSLARRSQVDGEPDPVLVHVPAGFAKGTGSLFPLVVALHGLNGTPERIVEVFLDSKNQGPSVDGFVVAPYAHGNAFYRGPGELEVMQTIDWMLATYPIDPDRVSITGVSMGGTGTAHLALRYAERFSAAAPLCGYHSYFVRRDTANRPLRAWERERMQHWSPASWAERGVNLPMWVAHGTKDFPLENSKVLVKRYKELGYSMTDEWPDTGHDVWTKAYAGARLWPWLSHARRDRSSARVVVKTDTLRFGKQDWVTVTRLAEPGHMGLLDATVVGASKIKIHAEGVGAFELQRAAGRIAKDADVALDVDGQALSFAAAEKIEAHRAGDAWQKGAATGSGKRAGLEGPIRDAYLEPLLFVYGTGSAKTTRANREVAEAFARNRHGPDVAYRVIPDVELGEAAEASHALFLVGTPADHRLLRKISAALPIRADAGKLWVGDKTHAAAGTGAIFIQPNPRHPDRYVVVVTGNDAAGIWRALSLPQLLPDFLVYDAALEPAAAEVVLGADAHVIAGGFFNQEWKLPTDIADRPQP